MSYTVNSIVPGSKWFANNFEKFQVINVTEIEGHTWVYYRKFNSDPEEIREYSCYIESFLSRFSKIENE